MTKLAGLLSIPIVAIGLLVADVAVASAQRYGPPPAYSGGQPGGFGFVQRRGLTLGGSIGFGGMSSPSSDLTECFDCQYSPIAGGFSAHLGFMINPRLAIVGEVSGVFQQLDEFGSSLLVQTQLLGAIQYWLTPQLWLKGGIGVSSLQVSYGDGGPNDEIDAGGALLGAVGFEVLQAPRFTLDLSLRLASGSYGGIDEQVNTGIIGVGANWF